MATSGVAFISPTIISPTDVSPTESFRRQSFRRQLSQWRSGAAKKNLLLALRISSGPALCNAGQHYPKKDMIYTILAHSTQITCT
jgi:hypothetical protein